MKADQDNDRIFREISSLYLEQEGEKLLQELADSANLPDLDPDLKLQKQIKKSRLWGKTRKALLVAAPLAACLMIFLFLGQPFFNQPGDNFSQPAHNQPLTPPPLTSSPNRVEIAFLDDKLPAGCLLTKTDYDNGKTIYHIKNDRNNEIIFAAEEDPGSIDTSNFTHTKVKGKDAYILAKRDYNILLIQSEGILYTGASAFEARDLLEIAAAII